MNNHIMLLLLCIVLLCATQQQLCLCASTLYGITAQFQLYKIDPLTFNNTELGWPTNLDPSQPQIRIDTPDYFIYWVAQSPDGVHQLSVRDVDKFQSANTITTDLPFIYVQCFILDYTTSNNVLVYGIIKIEQPNNRTTYQLGRVDPWGRFYVPIADYIDNYPPPYNSHCDYDAFNHILYIDEKGINGDTGKIEHIYSSWKIFYDTVNWDPKTGLFFLYGEEGEYTVVDSLNAKTGQFARVGSYTQFENFGKAAFDPVSRTLYVLAGTTQYTSSAAVLVSVNVDTGKLTNSIKECNAPYQCFRSMSVQYNRNDV